MYIYLEVWQSWPIALVLKTSEHENVPGVRIPQLPLKQNRLYSTAVVQLTCNEQVVGSNPTKGSKLYITKEFLLILFGLFITLRV